MKKFPISFLALLFLFYAIPVFSGPVTVLAPSQPGIEKAGTKAGKPKKAERTVPQDEIDVLMALMDPCEYQGRDMDRPSFFAMLRYPADFDAKTMQPEMRNLLGDVEEIRYLDRKAWGANVALKEPGLYEFVLEAKPWWDEDKQRYLHQQAKVVVPVLGVQNGWDQSFGQSFEILPKTRPFGLTAPAYFSARIMLDGKPLDNIAVQAGRINSTHTQAISKLHMTMETRTGTDGSFGFVFNEPGWWYCESRLDGAPLKGPDGSMKELDRSTVLWIYVDAPLTGK